MTSTQQFEELKRRIWQIANEVRGTVVPSGLGLANVRERLRLLYPGRHELTLDETDHRFVVSLMIDFAPL